MGALLLTLYKKPTISSGIFEFKACLEIYFRCHYKYTPLGINLIFVNGKLKINLHTATHIFQPMLYDA